MLRDVESLTEDQIIGDLSGYTPAQIDTTMGQLWTWIADAQKAIQAWRRAQKMHGEDAHYYGAHLKAPAAIATVEHERYTRLLTRLEGEYHRRGGWSRYWLVDAPNGHVHPNTHHTCNRTESTTHLWLTAVSGMGARELVDLAGYRACTNCFPWAPIEVLARPSVFMTTTEAAKAQRAAERAERAAQRAAKAITAPDGAQLRVRINGYIEHLKTVVAAERRAVEIMVDCAYAGSMLTTENRLAIREITEALAHKRGTDADTQQGVLNQKYLAKCKREGITALSI